MDDDERQQAWQFAHRVEHLRWRKGLGPLPEGEFVAECWMPDKAPDWALALAASGAPGTQWCPRVTPGLDHA